MAADDLLLRQAPHSPQAEQAVLGSMLIDPDCIKDVMENWNFIVKSLLSFHGFVESGVMI